MDLKWGNTGLLTGWPLHWKRPRRSQTYTPINLYRKPELYYHKVLCITLVVTTAWVRGPSVLLLRLSAAAWSVVISGCCWFSLFSWDVAALTLPMLHMWTAMIMIMAVTWSTGCNNELFWCFGDTSQLCSEPFQPAAQLRSMPRSTGGLWTYVLSTNQIN